LYIDEIKYSKGTVQIIITIKSHVGNTCVTASFHPKKKGGGVHIKLV